MRRCVYAGSQDQRYALQCWGRDEGGVGVCLLLSVGWAQEPKPGGTLRVAWEQGEFSRLSLEVQRYIVRNMIQISARTLPCIQVTRDSVKGYVYDPGFKLRFATT
jgi:hypothetical protein